MTRPLVSKTVYGLIRTAKSPPQHGVICMAGCAESYFAHPHDIGKQRTYLPCMETEDCPLCAIQAITLRLIFAPAMNDTGEAAVYVLSQREVYTINEKGTDSDIDIDHPFRVRFSDGVPTEVLAETRHDFLDLMAPVTKMLDAVRRPTYQETITMMSQTPDLDEDSSGIGTEHE